MRFEAKRTCGVMGTQLRKGACMEVNDSRVAAIAIIVEDTDSVEALNATLHEYGNFIIGRMGVPYRARGINIITVAIDAPQDTIAALTGKIGALEGVSVKTAYSK